MWTQTKPPQNTFWKALKLLASVAQFVAQHQAASLVWLKVHELRQEGEKWHHTHNTYIYIAIEAENAFNIWNMIFAIRECTIVIPKWRGKKNRKNIIFLIILGFFPFPMIMKIPEIFINSSSQCTCSVWKTLAEVGGAATSSPSFCESPRGDPRPRGVWVI